MKKIHSLQFVVSVFILGVVAILLIPCIFHFIF